MIVSVYRSVGDKDRRVKPKVPQKRNLEEGQRSRRRGDENPRSRIHLPLLPPPRSASLLHHCRCLAWCTSLPWCSSLTHGRCLHHADSSTDIPWLGSCYGHLLGASAGPNVHVDNSIYSSDQPTHDARDSATPATTSSRQRGIFLLLRFLLRGSVRRFPTSDLPERSHLRLGQAWHIVRKDE